MAGYRKVAFLTSVLLCCTSFLFGQKITVAAASDLQFVLREVADRFQKDTGTQVELIFGSSGNLFTQIQNGAPFDVFFSADSEYPKKLESDGFVEPGTSYRYATGKIVLWTRKESKLDLSQGLEVLRDASIKKIAIANPEHAPYGRAAVAAMRKSNLYDQVADKLVLGENISQTATFVASGNADIGIIALSLALAPAISQQGRCGKIPSEAYPAIEQAAVVLKASKQKGLAEAFLKLLKDPQIILLMQKNGFTVPGASDAAQDGKGSSREQTLACM